MTRHLHDLDFLTSVGLLVAAVAAALTGIIADLWDLNDFWYHTVSGYVMAAFGVVHVVLNRQRLTGYARFRWRSLREPNDPVARRAGPRPSPSPSAPAAASAPRIERALVSRRGLLGLGIGAIAGLLLGRGLRQPPPIAAGSDVGVIYHQWSKPGILDALGTLTDWGSSVDLYKRYPNRPTIVLPKVSEATTVASAMPTATAIRARRSTRAYATDRPLTQAELSQLLFETAGITAGLSGNARRSAPSSGALYPIEAYVVVHRVDGIEPGVYHYAVREHALVELRAGDFRSAVVEQSIAQEFLGECGVVLFLTMILQRMRPRYQDRSYRYGLLEAGHLGENAYLSATAMGLGACGVGAFMDDAINEMLGVDGVDEAAVYMLAVGHRRDAV